MTGTAPQGTMVPLKGTDLPRRLERWGAAKPARWAWYAALAAASVVGLWKVALWAVLEAKGMPHSDALIMAAVGRGMLQGLRPYIDLFETKTPAVFLIFATSYALSGGLKLVFLMQAAVVLLFPASVVAATAAVRRNAQALLFATAVGSGIAIYAMMTGGRLHSELWGVWLSVLFLALYCLWQNRAAWRWYMWGALAALFLLATAMKEPFALSIAGCVVLLGRSREDARRMAVIAGIAAAAGIVLLLPFPFFRGFFTVYLPHMLTFHVSNPWGTLNEPLWLRTIDVFRLWGSLGSVPGFRWQVLLLGIGALVLLMAGAPRKRRRWALAQWLAAVWLHTAAIGAAGDFYAHHFAFVVPLIVAFLLLWLRRGDVLPPALRMAGAGSVAALSLVVAFRAGVSLERLGRIHGEWQQWSAERERIAFTVDEVMYRCGMERYFLLLERPDGLYAFTRHAPLGPVFTLYQRNVKANGLFRSSFARAIAAAPVIVTSADEDRGTIAVGMKEAVDAAYTEEMPPCAYPYLQPSPYQMLFRKTEAKPST